MPVNNGIITAPVTIQDVQITIGDASVDLGDLCQSGKINKWARFKPVAVNTLFPAVNPSESTWFKGMDGKCGLFLPISTTVNDLKTQVLLTTTARDWTFNFATIPPTRPVGGTESPFRLTDFNNYNHLAESIILNQVMSTNVNNSNNFVGEVTFQNILTNLTDSVDRTNLGFGDFYMFLNEGPWYLAICISTISGTPKWKTRTTSIFVRETIGSDVQTITIAGSEIPAGAYSCFLFLSDVQKLTFGESTATGRFIPLPNLKVGELVSTATTVLANGFHFGSFGSNLGNGITIDLPMEASSYTVTVYSVLNGVPTLPTYTQEGSYAVITISEGANGYFSVIIKSSRNTNQNARLWTVVIKQPGNSSVQLMLDINQWGSSGGAIN